MLANCNDCPLLPVLLWDLKARFLLADAGYDSKANKFAKTIRATTVIDKNPRKRYKTNKQKQNQH